MEGLRFLKAHKPEIALEHLTIAKSFDKTSSKIFIARGCALANMVDIYANRIILIRDIDKLSKLSAYPPIINRHSVI